MPAVQKRSAAVVAAIVLGGTCTPPSLAHAAPAPADTDGCVTRAEHRAVKHGMTKLRVHGVFDTPGTRIFLIPGNEERRAYRTCDPTLRLSVVYLRGRLGYRQLREVRR